MDNRIDTTFSDDQQKAANKAIDDLQAALSFLYDLSPEERRELYKLGDKSRAFVDAALITAQTHTDMLPRAFDLAQYETDVALYRGLEPLFVRLRDLFERIEDTRMLAGAEAMEAARAVYYYTKGHPGAGALSEASKALGRRFDRRPAADTTPGDKEG